MDHDLPDREEIACALEVMESRLARQGQYDQAVDVFAASRLLRLADDEITRLRAENARLTAERDAAQAAMVDGALREAALLARAERAERAIQIALDLAQTTAGKTAIHSALVEACEGGDDSEG